MDPKLFPLSARATKSSLTSQHRIFQHPQKVVAALPAAFQIRRANKARGGILENCLRQSEQGLKRKSTTDNAQNVPKSGEKMNRN